jgi:hypothetical protein
VVPVAFWPCRTSSREASLPIQRAEGTSDPASRAATAAAAAASEALRLPIAFSAMLTAFFTKLRSSAAARSMSPSPAMNA